MITKKLNDVDKQGLTNLVNLAQDIFYGTSMFMKMSEDRDKVRGEKENFYLDIGIEKSGELINYVNSLNMESFINLYNAIEENVNDLKNGEGKETKYKEGFNHSIEKWDYNVYKILLDTFNVVAFKNGIIKKDELSRELINENAIKLFQLANSIHFSSAVLNNEIMFKFEDYKKYLNVKGTEKELEERKKELLAEIKRIVKKDENSAREVYTEYLPLLYSKIVNSCECENASTNNNFYLRSVMPEIKYQDYLKNTWAYLKDFIYAYGVASRCHLQFDFPLDEKMSDDERRKILNVTQKMFGKSISIVPEHLKIIGRDLSKKDCEAVLNATKKSRKGVRALEEDIDEEQEK